MSTLVECVPNFSEGRDPYKVGQIAATIRTVPGVYVLDFHRDPDHNRSVMTLVGSHETVSEAALRVVGQAVALIDLNRHQGEHPRIGAADVVPFIPVRGVTLEDCVRIAHETGKEIYRRFQVPVYFYEAAALQPGRENLENIRRGGFEELKSQAVDDPSRQPDVGGPQLHPTAGATAVGARHLLIAFNINLDSSDRKVAQEIARKIRSSGGGLPALKAMGVLLNSRSVGGRAGQAQVSMNLTDFEKTSLAEAFRVVEREAARLGASIASSELVGLIPQKALAGTSPEALKIAGFHPLKILENKLAEVLPPG
ncbi:MAG: glutamate formimidoyltransferase [Acidobacteria bacterium RIFCSPLOWO2_12_FULL_59_11]|nr:MAG: glutamate formimidoyltransferase [Acidobacteria bacterium RIFCSPLOWO2_12_FULL_59_11]